MPDFYDRLKRSYDDKFFEQEVLGKYLNVSDGQVYHAFDRSRNVAETERWTRRLPLLWALDFNVDPMCSVVAQIAGRRGARAGRDRAEHARRTPQACEEFLERYPSARSAGWSIYGDASGTQTADDRVERLRDGAGGAFARAACKCRQLPGAAGESGGAGAGERW